MLEIRTILHPTALAEKDLSAARVAVSLARAIGARLVILHVVRPWYVHGRGALYSAFLRQKHERSEDLGRYPPGRTGITCERRLVEGEPTGAILAAAAEVRCDLIVMGTRGRSELGRLLAAGTADAVSRRAHCPVLMVRPAPEAPPRGVGVTRAAGRRAGRRPCGR
ncbi:universal stress protein [bacterium]|nr:universal stress protein [bacterium]